MKEINQKLTLDRLAVYEIKVPGELDEGRTEWDHPDRHPRPGCFA
jgi:hypothetical protein